jgi:hypothetical protein
MHDVSRKGQTIIEALVALSILTIGLIGVLTLLSHSLYLQRVTADQVKGTYLAAEGIEIAKSLIDNNVYDGVARGDEMGGWVGSYTGCFNFGAGGAEYYTLDFRTTAATCPAGSLQPDPVQLSLGPDRNPGMGNVLMYYDSTDVPPGVTATPTPFYRDIEVIRSSDNTSMDVIATVTWTTGGVPGKVVLQDMFYNWHP